MIKEYGHFNAELASFTLTQFPKVGNYEYIYKNDTILVKADQYGLQSCQIDPPTGIALIKRERREINSPARVYFSHNGRIYHNFDGFEAESVNISFTPEKATYLLNFGEISVKTELLVPVAGMRFIMRLTFINNTDSDISISALSAVYPYVNEFVMAPWDKPEWYTKTAYNDKNGAFITTRYSVVGKKEERRYFSVVSDLPIKSYELSSERLTESTNNFSRIPESFAGSCPSELYAFEQCIALCSALTITAHSSYSFSEVFATSKTENDVEPDICISKTYFSHKAVSEEERRLEQKYSRLFSVQTINTNDDAFNKFINGFLPLELDWVSSLDRGWPTGMRGVRDASNDFQGFLAYDTKKCKEIIENIFSKQQSDGWYPRQVPFGGGDKFDLRHFIDSACFFTEFVYDYLSYSDDYSILEKKYAYYDKDEYENGLTHLIKGIEYLTKPENIGEHGLAKMRGGDWLDCLNSAGLMGRGESVMVSCQLVMCLRYLAEILEKVGNTDYQKYLIYADKLTEKINLTCYNTSGFYNGVFTDRGEWIFSDNDPDGEKRVYSPTNSYAIISGVADSREQSVIDNLETLRTDMGYRLFTEPFGKKHISGIGKMGTGDFQAYFSENAGIYNHGSQFFYIRALAKVGDHEKLYKVLNYAMPYNSNYHSEKEICSAPYAITNCYHLIPSFYGRAGFSFLTGSVAMLERSVYNWMFGIRFTPDQIIIRPCLPKEYGNSEITVRYSNRAIKIKFNGYGNKIKLAAINKKAANLSDSTLQISKDLFKEYRSDILIELNLNLK